MSAVMYLYYPLKDRLYVDLLCDDMNKNLQGVCADSMVDRLLPPHPLPHVRIVVKDVNQFLQWVQPRLQQCSLLYYQQGCCWLGRELQMDATCLFEL